MNWRFCRVPARNGEDSLQLVSDEGGLLRVHSPLDPGREARRMLASLSLEGAPLLVIAGGGLGWLAREAEGSNPAPCAILELEPPAADTILRGKPSPRGIRLSGTAADLVQRVTREQMQRGWPDIVFVANAAYQKAFPAWCEDLQAHFRPGRNTCELGHSRREAWQGRRVLVIQSGYFLLRECVEAFREMDCEVGLVPLSASEQVISPTFRSGGPKVDADFPGRLLEAIRDQRPDVVFTVNHIGLDSEGRLLDLLKSLRLPLVSWFVDSPVYILDGHRQVASDWTHLFVWERHWMAPMRELGFASVDWLPLAGHSAFRRMPAKAPRRDLGFVGGSNVEAVGKWRNRLRLPQERNTELEALLAAWRNALALPGASLKRCLGDFPRLAAGLDKDRRRVLESWLVLKATQLDRLEMARRFRERDFVLHGDPGWRELDGRLPLRAPLEYYSELPLHYGENRINLNRTSRQMPTALNQRAFDVPLCGSVVLGDHRSDLQELFEPGRDCLSWRSLDEAEALAEELLADEKRRLALARSARRTVIQRHLYRHRIGTILETLHTYHGSTAPAGSAVVREDQ